MSLRAALLGGGSGIKNPSVFHKFEFDPDGHNLGTIGPHYGFDSFLMIL
jgi:hypothetical protein